jgi:hypothetical protein
MMWLLAAGLIAANANKPKPAPKPEPPKTEQVAPAAPKK